MVFNWFRRQFDKSDQVTPDQAAQAPPSSSSEEQTAEERAATPATAEDYLQWAKAAYKNIQQQQQQQPQGVETPESRAIATPETDDVPPQTAAEPDTEPAAPEEPGVATATADATVEPPSKPASTTVPAETPTVPASETSAALPFWARAEAEKQARLERLKATAIDEPEPVLESSATPTTASPTPESELSEQASALTFDEGFLWSAEVLAGQGRRPEEVSIEEITWLQQLRRGLDKTRRGLINQLKAIVGQGPLNQAAVAEIEDLLLQADVGIEATDTVIESLQEKMREETLPPEAAIRYLKQILRNMLDQPLGENYSPTFAPDKGSFNIWLITGVNGAGKTTTIGKIAHLARKSDYKCLIAAADTFRAAAVEQVKIWGDRSDVDVIANPATNTDPAAVVFDAINAARARGVELLLIDTAGRLQNKKNLMEELSKIRKIIGKQAPDAQVESLLVLDATLGQNGLRQAEVFSEIAQLSGVVLTKLDGTAKGGVALAVVQQLGLPIRFLGAGEGLQDLRPFSSYEFVEALLAG